MSMSSTTGQPMGLGLGAGRSTESNLSDSEQRSTLIMLIASVTILIAAYWDTFAFTKEFWDNPTYSHGWIIPLIAIFLMWTQRKPLGGLITQEQENRNFVHVGIPLAVAIGCYFLGQYGLGWGAYAVAVLVALTTVFRFHQFETVPLLDRWIGAGLVTMVLPIRYFSTLYEKLYFDRYSFLLALFGVFMMVGGLPLIRRMWASIVFFFFMFPLPSKVEHLFLLYLQKMAAMASTTVLQILGLNAHRIGSQMNVQGMDLEVAEACSGLRMLTIFGAMVIAMVLIIERPWWDKLILLLSAVPIALATNVIRITITALLFYAVQGSEWEEPLHKYIHDIAGYAMIFIAGGIMWVEYKILVNLFVAEGDEALRATGIVGRGAKMSR